MTMKMNAWHGITMQSISLTEALGTGSQVRLPANTPSTMPSISTGATGCGGITQFLFNTWLVYQPPYFQNQPVSLDTFWAVGPLRPLSTSAVACRWGLCRECYKLSL
jgi:hypothetical protein